MQQDIWSLKQTRNSAMIPLYPLQVWCSLVHAPLRSIRLFGPLSKIRRCIMFLVIKACNDRRDVEQTQVAMHSSFHLFYVVFIVIVVVIDVILLWIGLIRGSLDSMCYNLSQTLARGRALCTGCCILWWRRLLISTWPMLWTLNYKSMARIIWVLLLRPLRRFIFYLSLIHIWRCRRRG